MKKVCAMTSSIFCFDKPAPSIKQLREAGVGGVMFDYSPFCSAPGLLRLRKRMEEAERTGEEKPKWRPKKAMEYYEKVTDAFAEYRFLPSIARLPFVDARMRLEEPAEYEELKELTIRVNRDCIAAAEALGCTHIVVQPLFMGIERGQEWEVNREYYLTLAQACQKKETKLLLVNQCVDRNGHLMRGICSDGREAAAWVDALNKGAAKRFGGEDDTAGNGRFGFCLDIGNCNLCGQNIQSMVSALGSRIQAVILTENDGQRPAKLLPFTNAYNRSSTLDWLGVIRGLREIAFDGYLILETVDTTVAFSPLLQPYLYPLYGALLDYFEMQIQIERDLKKYQQIALFGAGNMCRNYLKCYGDKYPPLFTCDNNPKLWGTELEGLAVRDPEELKNLPDNSGVIICNIFYREIEAQLRSMGITNIGYFNDEYMPSFYFDRLKREIPDEEDEDTAE